jgi:hypothetical protein
MLKVEVALATAKVVPHTATMASHTVSKAEQYEIGDKVYFRFFTPSETGFALGRTRGIWTSAPKNLAKCPRMELNRLARLLEGKGLRLPQTLRYIKKKDLINLLEPLLAFE